MIGYWIGFVVCALIIYCMLRAEALEDEKLALAASLLLSLLWPVWAVAVVMMLFVYAITRMLSLIIKW